jgi:hypothetical protein
VTRQQSSPRGQCGLACPAAKGCRAKLKGNLLDRGSAAEGERAEMKVYLIGLAPAAGTWPWQAGRLGSCWVGMGPGVEKKGEVEGVFACSGGG